MSEQDPTVPGAGAPPPSEEELRAAYEAELDRINAIDMIAQAAVSLLNVGARRLGPPPGQPGDPASPAGTGQDLEQAGDAIDAARALLAILERRIPQELGPLRDALSRLQMAYAAEVGSGAPAAAGPEPGAAQPGGQPGAPGQGGTLGQGGAPGPGAPVQKPAGDPAAGGQESGEKQGPGPAESSGRLWVPGR
jgi:hypothetical protein